MAIPGYQDFMLPLLRMAGDGGEHTQPEAVDLLSREVRLTDEDRKEVLASGGSRVANRIGWAITYLKKAGLLRAMRKGHFQITDSGRELLSKNPAPIDAKFLETHFPEIREFLGRNPVTDEEPPATYNEAARAWVMRPVVEDRLRAKLERSVPDEGSRRAAIELLAFVIENADEERSDGWCLRETPHGLKLMAGRLQACKVTRSKVELSVIGPVDDEIRAVLGAERDDDYEFKWIPGGVVLRFPVERAGEALRLLRDDINSFVDLSMARVRRAVDLEDHVPEGVAYVAKVVGRELPQLEPGAEAEGSEESDDGTDDGVGVSREPLVRGRAPIFEHGQRSIASLLSDIEREAIALPDLQRPFVWEDTKVRDLLDSLFLGFPVGTLVLWHTSSEKEARAVGADRAGLRSTTLVIDGQQRLTSLSAAVGGKEIVDKDGEKRRITIAFRPRDGRFEVADAAIRNDPEFISNVTELWKGPRPKMQIRRDLMNGLRDKGRAIDDKYEYAVEWNLDRAHAISDYRFPTVDIRKTAGASEGEATEEDVADVFVRINNQGTRLGQADFVLTLLSVFHGDLRDRIENRAREMSQGTVVTIDTQQLLRAACAVAFDRARMSAVYRFLRGVDPATGEADPASRVRRLDELDEAAKLCMESTPWRDYLLRVRHAGFVNHGLIASRNAVVNAYAFYVRGRKTGVEKARLDELISRWTFATLLTARYSGSSETIFEQDLARVARLAARDADGFVRALDNAMSESVTGDYWTRTLVATLETQKARSPAPLAFRAAQVVLGTRALFSDQLLQNLLDPPAQGGRSASEAHHLFPEAWLHARGVRERRRVNQVANLADVGWHDNSLIGSHGPAQYVPRLREKLRLDDDRWGRMCAEHALPPDWERMEYETFLVERRRRMAEIIRVAFRKLGGESDAQPVNPPWFLAGGELVWQRIAATERALRAAVRDVYGAVYGDKAAQRIVGALPQPEREGLERALQTRPAGADPLSVVDYLYLAQLPVLLLANDVWAVARDRFGIREDAKNRLRSAIAEIAPVRNAIAHVREVEQNALMRATVACEDVLAMLRSGSPQSKA